MICYKKDDILKVPRNILNGVSRKNIQSFFENLISEILNSKKDILKSNQQDIQSLQKEKKEMSAFIDRLTLTDQRIDSIIDGIREVMNQPCYFGKKIEEKELKNGLILQKISIPIGRIFVIYESRPNVTIDVAILGVKSRNSIVLKGGKESLHTNKILFSMIQKALLTSQLPQEVCQLFIPDSKDELVDYIQDHNRIDLLVPRGGKRLQKFVFDHARVPILKHLEGLCHLYIHKEADSKMAHSIAINAKCQRPGVCNAIETILVDKDYAETASLIQSLIEKGVEVRVDKNLSHLEKESTIKAFDKDWKTEYLEKIISIKQVENVNEAIEHINLYGSGHSDAIVTTNQKVAQIFISEVDSVAVYHNASTRFTDGYMMGKGAEIGISTDRLHARGPVGLEELMTYKYCILGKGQVR